MVKVKTVLHRNDPIIFGMPPGISGKSVALSAANVWLALEKAGVTDVQGVWEYQTRYITVISIKQKYGGHVKRAAMAMLGSTYGYHRRFVIIVDDDVDPSNIDDVLWALATRCDPATAINVISEAWSTPLDPRIAPEARAARNFTNSVAIINACQPITGKISTPRLAIFRRRRGGRQRRSGRTSSNSTEGENFLQVHARRAGGRGSGLEPIAKLLERLQTIS